MQRNLALDVWHFEINGSPICRFERFKNTECQYSSQRFEDVWDDIDFLASEDNLSVTAVHGPCPYHKDRSPNC